VFELANRRQHMTEIELREKDARDPPQFSGDPAD
jgi:hypothetical protein